MRRQFCWLLVSTSFFQICLGQSTRVHPLPDAPIASASQLPEHSAIGIPLGSIHPPPGRVFSRGLIWADATMFASTAAYVQADYRLRYSGKLWSGQTRAHEYGVRLGAEGALAAFEIWAKRKHRESYQGLRALPYFVAFGNIAFSLIILAQHADKKG